MDKHRTVNRIILSYSNSKRSAQIEITIRRDIRILAEGRRRKWRSLIYLNVFVGTRYTYLPLQLRVSHRTKRSSGIPRWPRRIPGTARPRNCNKDSRASCQAADTWRSSLPVPSCRPPTPPNRWNGNRRGCHQACARFETSPSPATCASSAAKSSTYYYYRADLFPARPKPLIVSLDDARWCFPAKRIVNASLCMSERPRFDK